MKQKDCPRNSTISEDTGATGDSDEMNTFHPDWKADEEMVGKLTYFKEKHNFVLKGPYETMVSVENWELKYVDAVRLAPGTTLNDAVMNFFFKLFMNYSFGSLQQGEIFAFNTFFWKKLSSVADAVEANCKNQASAYFKFKECYQKLKVFHKGVDLFTKSHLFIPIHKEGHWCAVVVTNLPELLKKYKRLASSDGKYCSVENNQDFRIEPKILQLDPLYRADPRHGGIVRHYLELVLEEALEPAMYNRAKSLLKKTPHECLLDPVSIPDMQIIAPRQINRVDCGLFVMEYFESFAARHQEIFHQLNRHGEIHQLFPLSMISNKRTMLFNLLVRNAESSSMETALEKYFQEREIVLSESSHYPEEYDSVCLQQAQESFKLRREKSYADFGCFYYATLEGKWTRFVGGSGSKQKPVPEIGVKKRYRFDDPDREMSLADLYYSVLPQRVAIESAGGIEEIERPPEAMEHANPLVALINPNRNANLRSRIAQNTKAIEKFTLKLEGRNDMFLGKRSRFEASVQEVVLQQVTSVDGPEVDTWYDKYQEPDSLDTAEELEVVEVVSRPMKQKTPVTNKAAARQQDKRQTHGYGWNSETKHKSSLPAVHRYSRFSYRTIARVGV